MGSARPFSFRKKRVRDASGHKLVFLTNLFSFERFFESFLIKWRQSLNQLYDDFSCLDNDMVSISVLYQIKRNCHVYVFCSCTSLSIYVLVSKQLKDIIKRLVMDSFLDQYYPKALECVKKFKEEAVKVSFVLICVHFVFS